jgi:hypothetical protein
MDSLITDLVEVIAETYAFVVDTHQDLKDDLTDKQEKICKAMLEQTMECGHFISLYASKNSSKSLSYS